MMSREHIKNDLLERRISAIIRTENQKVADQAKQAAVDGRFRDDIWVRLKKNQNRFFPVVSSNAFFKS